MLELYSDLQCDALSGKRLNVPTEQLLPALKKVFFTFFTLYILDFNFQ